MFFCVCLHSKKGCLSQVERLMLLCVWLVSALTQVRGNSIPLKSSWYFPREELDCLLALLAASSHRERVEAGIPAVVMLPRLFIFLCNKRLKGWMRVRERERAAGWCQWQHHCNLIGRSNDGTCEFNRGDLFVGKLELALTTFCPMVSVL